MRQQIAIITGAGSGIGRACAHQLAARGHAVVIADINATAAQTVADEIIRAGGRATARHRVSWSMAPLAVL